MVVRLVELGPVDFGLGGLYCVLAAIFFAARVEFSKTNIYKKVFYCATRLGIYY